MGARLVRMAFWVASLVVAMAALPAGAWAQGNPIVQPPAGLPDSAAPTSAPLPRVPPLDLPSNVAPPEGREHVVISIEISGAITQQTEELFSAALEAAHARHAQALLIVLDTPGGLLDATRTIVQKMLDAPLPVITLVYPAGARAASAGLFLTLASHVAAMHPTSHMGAAHPVAAFGRDIEGSMGEKVLNDTAAWARSLAQARGRDGVWAEKAVRESVSATASEALERHVIDLLAADASAVLAAADGRVVAVHNRPWRVTTQGAELVRVDPTARQRLYIALGNPVLVYLLLIVGALGLFIELTSPGLIIPGAIGILAMATVFGLQVLPMNGFGLLLLGVAALSFLAEVYVTSFGLLTLAGLVCLTIGSYLLFDVPGSSLRLAPSVIWATVLAVLLLGAGFAYKLLQIQRQGASSGPETWLGSEARVTVAIPAGGLGRVFFDGTLWNATSPVALERERLCRVTQVEGLLLHVLPLASAARGPSAPPTPPGSA